MKEQINRYARGAFEYEPLSALIEPEMIIASAKRKGADIEGADGSICISEKYGREIKGLLYSTNNRVRLNSSKFIGQNCVVSYQVDASGIETGDRIDGSIIAVTNGGEIEVPYEFEVVAGAYSSGAGEISNLFQFANLARDNAKEALRIFADADFADIFLNGDLSLCRLRSELMQGSDIKTAMEEFLIAVHKKSAVSISLEKEEISVEGFEGERNMSVVVSKNVWGHLNLRVSADGDFIDIGRTSLTGEDFVGGKLEYTFCLRSSGLHAGRNTGRIVFSTPFEKKTLVIRVDNTAENDARLISIFERRSVITLMRTYMNFRLNRIDAAAWAAASKTALEELLKNDEDDPYCCLLMSQILITDNKMNEAKYYLECARDDAVAGRADDEVLYCYYLYVSTLYNRDRTYALETAQTVKDIYENGSSDWRILWILLYFDVEMSKNKSLKLLRIKEQFNRGMRSPALFLEACLILNEQPLLLRVLNDFEIHVLLYGCKEGILEEKLLKQAAGLAGNFDGRQRLLYRLLTKMYAISEDDEVLEAICGILIRNGMKGTKYIKWYERGIERGIRVTRLYEYYLASRDRDDTSPLPKMVLLYFGYNSELERGLRAYLYANIIRNRQDNPQIYSNYAVRMNEFVDEELKRGTADENTGVVLAQYLKKDKIDIANAAGAADVMFTYKLSFCNPAIKSVIVGHKELVDTVKYPVENGCAYIKLYTSEPCICFEDGFGRLYKDTVEYRLERVYTNEVMIKQLMPYCDGNLLLSLHFCERSRAQKVKPLELIRMYGKLARDERLCPEYRQHLVAQVIDYYYDNYEGIDIRRLLDSQQGEGVFEPDRLMEAHRIKLIEILIIYGKYEDAYSLLAGTGFEGLNPKRALRLCDHIMEEHKAQEGTQPDSLLVELAYYTFSKGKYSTALLEFLNMNYNGQTPDMLKLWSAGLEAGADVYELEERIICQMLFAGEYTEELHKVFGHYKDNGARERIVEAYIAYGADKYFVRDEKVDDSVFEYIEAWLAAGRDVICLCRLALLKYYSVCESLSGERIQTAKELVYELAGKGYVFSFFTQLSRYFVLPYQIADKTVVEYRANPENRVVLHYAMGGAGRSDDEFTAVDMKNMYAGVYARPFVLFSDERMEYYITEEKPDGTKRTDVAVLQGRKIGSPSDRFGRLNDIISLADGSGEGMREALRDKLAKKIRDYAELDDIVRTDFKPIV